MATETPVANVPPPAQTPLKKADTVMLEAKKETSPAVSTPVSALGSVPAATPQVASTPQQQVLALNQQEYPAALATNEAVIGDERLFMDIFYKFHEALKSKPTIPKMGGKDLNVHLLYKEVCARGGLQQVIRDRKWKEITGAFEFPRTTTSASYVLRKYYVNLLHHFEQVYKNGSKGPLIPPPATLPGSSPSVQPGDPALSEGGDQVTKKRPRKRKIQMPLIPQVDPAEAIGTACKGSIEAKLDFGYLITMVVGGEKLKGVLYHVPTGVKVPSQFTNLPTLLASVNLDAAKTTVETTARRKRRRKEEMPKKDPNAPRPNRTGYNFFFAEQRQRLKALHPDKDRDISRMIGEAWNSLSEEQKTPYQERGVKDKERFKREMRDYREKMKSGYFDSAAADLGTGQAVTSPEDPSVPDQPLLQDHANAMGDDTPPTGEPTSETPHQQTSQEPSKGVPDQSLNQQTLAVVVSTQGEG